MPDIRVTAKTFKVSGNFRWIAAELPQRVARRERHYRSLLRARIVANASGRPGPEVITGEYIDSIEVRGAWVGTDDPRGKRLEFGYHGPDADGVTYDQPPYPHFHSAVEEVRPLFFGSMERLTAELVSDLRSSFPGAVAAERGAQAAIGEAMA